MYNLNYNKKMKAKILFSALCLTTTFAACTSEDIVENNAGDISLENRAVIDLKVVAGVESRLDKNSQWGPTDAIGSTLVDPKALFSVETDYRIENNRWENQSVSEAGGRFTTDGTTVEGAWMFYYPYNTKFSKPRTDIETSFDLKNQVYDADNTHMYGNDFRISPIYFVNASESDPEISVNLNSVYAYGRIQAALEEGTKVNKVLIHYETEGGFPNILQIDAEKVATTASMVYAKDGSGNPVKSGAGVVPGTDINKAMDMLRNYDSANKTVGYSYTTEEISDIFTTKTNAEYILIDCADAKAVGKANEEGYNFLTRVLLPSGKFSTDFKVYFYTDKGIYSCGIANHEESNLYFKRGTTVNLANVNRLELEDDEKTEDIDESLAVLMPVAVEGLAPITETADLVTLIQQFDGEAAGVNRVMDLTDILILEDVEFNDAVAEALEANATIDKLIVDEININCTKAQTIEKLVAKEVAVNAGDITIGGNWAVDKLTIENGASVTVAKNCGKDESETLVKGELNVNNGVRYVSYIDSEGGIITLGNSVSRSASDVKVYLRNIKSGALIVNTATNYGLTNLSTYLGSDDAALTVTLNASFTNEKGNKTEILSNATVTSAVALTVKKNEGTIIANNTLNVDENAGAITANGNLNVKTNSGDIVNKADGEIEKNSGSVENHKNLNVVNNLGTIDNKAAVAKTIVKSNGAEDADNSKAIINTLAKSMAFVTDNYGTVNLVSEAVIDVTNNMGKKADAYNSRYGHVVYTVDEPATDADMAALIAKFDEDITKLILNADFTITATTLNGEGAIQIPSLKYVETGAITIKVEAGKKQMFWDCPILFTENVRFEGAGEVYFYDGTLVTLALGKELIVNNTKLYFEKGSSFENNGSVYNAGIVSFEEASQLIDKGAWTGTEVSANFKVVNNAKDLKTAAVAGGDIKMTADMAITESLDFEKVTNFDASGKTLSGDVRGLIVGFEGGSIKNLTIKGENKKVGGNSTRGIFNDKNPSSKDVVINNYTVSGVGYAFNLYAEDGSNINCYVTNSNIEGWASTNGNFANVYFVGTNFTVGTYFEAGNIWNGCVNSYAATTFENCNFEEGYKVDWAEKNTNVPVVFKNCTLNGSLITKENVKNLLASCIDVAYVTVE